MRIIFGFVSFLFAFSCIADDAIELSPDEVKSIVDSVNEAQNEMMMLGSDLDDVDSLFSMYTDNFVYIHEVYGGVYTREELYRKSSKYAKAGNYNLTEGRYKILRIITGLNAAAVERLEVKTGNIHLSLFELEGGKVSKITEFWK